jgi:MFS family permease
MSLARYKRLVSNPTLRGVLLLGLLVRLPSFASGVVLTLHVISKLGRNYGAAGLVVAASTLAVTLSNPWRGRLLDRLGLRRVLTPSILVGGACWLVAPFAAYEWLLVLTALAGLFSVPSFSIIRQSVIAAVDESDRRSALSLDSVMVEMAFMVGPAVGVWAASTWRTDWVLLSLQLLGVLAGVLLWIVNPRLRQSPSTGTGETTARTFLLTAPFLTLCATGAASTVVLTSTDICAVAAMRSFGAQSSIGWVLAVWGAGSLLGGLFYGSLHKSISAPWLLGALGLTTLPLALAPNVALLAGGVFIAGMLCAPTITATLDQISRVVPEAFRGEAMGWHGSSMMLGTALGAPMAGAAIDGWGWPVAIGMMSMLGVVVAGVGATVERLSRRP